MSGLRVKNRPELCNDKLLITESSLWCNEDVVVLKQYKPSYVSHHDNFINHKNYNFLDCDWFKKLLFSPKFICQVVIGQFVIG